MSQEFALTTPITADPIVTSAYRVISVTLNGEAPSMMPGPPGAPGTPSGYVSITLRDNNDVQSAYTYNGQEALDIIAFINTADFSAKSLHARLLEKLAGDGSLTGTVTGMPDPPLGDPGL